MKRELTTAALAAKEIRKILKSKGIKASVKSDNFAGGDAVRIHLLNASPAVQEWVNDVTCAYQYGHFDGMTDCYHYSNGDSSLPQVKYVQVDTDFDDEIKQAAWSKISIEYIGQNGVTENYNECRGERLSNGDYIANVVYRYLMGSLSSHLGCYFDDVAK